MRLDHRQDIEYLVEIAWCIGTAKCKKEMDEILSKYPKQEALFDYDNYLDFYEYILEWVYNEPEYSNILDSIYEITNNNKRILEVREKFLSTYKK